MQIRDYQPSDEQAWLRCRVVSFMDCSYYQDVQQHRQTFDRPSIESVAIDKGQIVGLIDVERDSPAMTYRLEPGAMIWNLAVLPEYRRQSVAKKLWLAVKQRLLNLNLHYCELWTQEDIPANLFYQHNGFTLDQASTYLRCTISGRQMPLQLSDKLNKFAFVEDMTFETEVSERAQVTPVVDEVMEVRLYVQHF